MSKEMRHSGIYWLGDIPKSWTIGRVKDFYTLQTGFTPDTKNDTYYDDVNGKLWVNISDMGKSYYISETKKKISDWYIEKFKPIIVPKGSLLYSFKLSVGTVAIAGCDLYTNEAIASFLNNDKVNLKYLYYSSQVCIIHNANENIYGAKLLNQDLINNAIIVFPPLSKQQKIADYLDKICGEVDEMITLQEKMIEELKAYKQSIITEAVTKGLNPNVPMKNSGIDWIGEIPAHWKLEPIKYCFGRRSEKNSPVKTEERLSLSIDKGVTLYAEKTTNLDRFKDDFTQYQLAYPNDIVLNCMNMIVGAVGLSNYMGCVSPVYYVIYPSKQNINPLYYSYLLNIPTIRGVYYSLGKGIYAIERGEGKVNTCRLKVSYNDFGRLEIPVPPVQEQKDITLYIQKKCSEIDSLIAIKQQKIEELKEYKKSVIYEYVTGKKEVPYGE